MAVLESVKTSASSLELTGAHKAFPIRLLILFLVLEYARPPLVTELKLQMVIIVVMLVLWFAARSRPWSGILSAQVLFFLVCLQAIPVAANTYAAYFTARTMFGHLAIALGLSWLLANRSTFRRITWAWLLIMSYAAVYGIIHAGRGPGAMLGDENDLALGCATAFPFAFYGFERLSGRRRWLFGAIGGLMVVAIVLSFSRGGFVALAGAGLYCWAASRHKLRNLFVLAAASALLLMAAPEKGRTGESYVERIKSTLNTEEGTAQGRRFLWTTAVNMWKANPILGVGGGNFPYLAGRYQPNTFVGADYKERDWSGTVAHSVYFQVLAEHGTAGILILAYIVWAHFRILRRLRRAVRLRPDVPAEVRRDTELYSGALGGAVVGFCVAGAFLSVPYYPYLWYFSAMAVALDSAVRRDLDAVSDSAARARSLHVMRRRPAQLNPARERP
jgi:O-antigen ligase